MCMHIFLDMHAIDHRSQKSYSKEVLLRSY